MVAEDVSYTSILRISLPALLLNGDARLMSRSFCPLQCEYCNVSTVSVHMQWQLLSLSLYRQHCWADLVGALPRPLLLLWAQQQMQTCLLFNFLVDGISAKACFQD